MEELLNKLIEKGWKRKSKEKIEKATIRLSESWQVYFGTEEHPYLYADTLRGITSKNSGLWQFVCENGMVRNPDKYWKKYKELTISDGMVYMSGEYEYRILESALTDEDKLEDFILSNIKLD